VIARPAHLLPPEEGDQGEARREARDEAEDRHERVEVVRQTVVPEHEQGDGEREGGIDEGVEPGRFTAAEDLHST
jgi:hypothetical protein